MGAKHSVHIEWCFELDWRCESTADVIPRLGIVELGIVELGIVELGIVERWFSFVE